MKVALVGLPQSGKTTLFGALTRQPVKTGAAGYGAAPNQAVVEVPDARMDALVRMYQPRKVSYAIVEFVDGAPAADRRSAEAGFLQDARASDARVSRRGLTARVRRLCPSAVRWNARSRSSVPKRRQSSSRRWVLPNRGARASSGPFTIFLD